MKYLREEHRIVIASIMDDMGGAEEGYEVGRLSGDGSDRIFYRVVSPRDSSGKRPTAEKITLPNCIFVFPSPTNPKSLLEARACLAIGRHLRMAQIAVPEIFYFDPKTGVIVYEDLGDLLLHAEVSRTRDSSDGQLVQQSSEYIIALYEKAIDCLAHFQVYGGVEFDPLLCWDTPTYSKDLMVQRESIYFLEAFCLQYRALGEYPDGLESEFECLADRILREDCHFLMHRDFQSRNIMIKEGQIRIIDFQGARLGPLAYDLASLLNDPYIQLPINTREQLVDFYLDTIKKHISLDRKAFRKGYYHIALQRNLQVLGAFSFLLKERGKTFFKPYISPALNELNSLLHGPLKGHYPILAGFVETLSLT